MARIFKAFQKQMAGKSPHALPEAEQPSNHSSAKIGCYINEGFIHQRIHSSQVSNSREPKRKMKYRASTGKKNINHDVSPKSFIFLWNYISNDKLK